MKLNAVTDYIVDDGVAVLTIDSPPVNALGAPVRQGLAAGMARAEADDGVRAIVLICAGRTFFAGADITEFGKPPISPSLRELLETIEDCAKPTIAAIHGTALGGGLELALVAHFRVAVPGAKLGLPEVNLGLLPGAGGTQRLPRVVGVEKALDMIAGGAPVSAASARTMGLVDAVIDGDLLNGAVAFARQVVAEGRPLRKVRDRDDLLADARSDPALFDRFRKSNARRFRGFKAPENIIKAIEAAVTMPFAQGLARERELFNELLEDSQSAAQRHVFFAERQAARVAGVPADTPLLPVARVGVVGAGTMGGGIAMNFLNAGMPVTIVETAQAALDRGIATIRRNYDATAAKGRIRPEDVEQRMALLTPSLDLADLSDADLVIEAVFEDLDVKRQVFARLDGVIRPDAILATNTSYLDIDHIASALARPDRLIGLHFFSPANVMKLLEIVRTRDSAPEHLATAARLAKTIGKIGVTVGNGPGFVGNRILAARDAQVSRLLLEGASPTAIDQALYDFGFPMGHLQMRDLVGLDVGWKRETSNSSSVRDILNEMGRHGQKSGGGFYDYDAQRNATPSPVAARVIEEFAARQGIARREIDKAEILDRTLYAMVNEGARILDEGIAARASDIDIVWVTGYGWPRYRGGPMFWADLQGLPAVLDTLKALEAAHGEAFAPSPLIERLIAEQRGFNA